MSQTYDSDHYARIDRIERRHFWFLTRSRILQSVIRLYVPRPVGKSFLEIGFGTGIVLRILDAMGFQTTGIDVNARALLYAKKQTPARLVRRSVYTYNTNMRFDAVGAFDVLEHQQDDLLFLRKCAALVKPHGLLFLSVPAGKWLWSSLDVRSGHKRRYDPEDLHALLARAGFRVLFWNYWQVATLPIFFLWRLALERRSPKDVVNLYLRQPPVLVNALFYWMLRAEEFFFFRVRAPAGASLILCARKK